MPLTHPQSLQALQLSINVEKIRRLLQMQFASAQEEELKAALYAKAYFDSLHFGKLPRRLSDQLVHQVGVWR